MDQSEVFFHPYDSQKQAAGGDDDDDKEVTHTLSRSMSRLCLSLPSVVRKSLKCWIWSASSGFRLNSAGNSEIQYLEVKEREQILYVLA